MPDARCDELSGVGIYNDAKPGQAIDATDYSPRKLKPQCKTRTFGSLRPLPASHRVHGSRRRRITAVVSERVTRPIEIRGHPGDEPGTYSIFGLARTR